MVLAVAISIVLIWRVPSVRTKVVPSLRQGITALSVLRSRSKRLELFGGNLAGELTFALTLGATCHAFNVALSLPQLVLVNVGASVLFAVWNAINRPSVETIGFDALPAS